MINTNMLPLVGGPSPSVSGMLSVGSGNPSEELRKALEAGYGADVASLTGGGALRIQSLEKTMLATIQENKHFRLFNELAKTNATATVDEWTEQSGVGGFWGGSTNTETGAIATSTGSYARRVGQIKYLMTRREVSLVQVTQNTLVESEAVEATNGALQLLTDAEFLCFEGNSAVVPTEFDGIFKQISDLNDNHVIDAAGASLATVTPLMEAAAMISGYGNFGTPTHLFMSQLAQADFDANLDPAYRVALDGSAQSLVIGAPVKAINTSWGNIAACPDIFIRDEDRQKPFQVEFAALAAANSLVFEPVSVAGVAASDAASKFVTAQAGNYWYAVAGITAAGQSEVVKDQVAVVAGDKVTLTITASTGGTETGYVIFRGSKNGADDPNDFRYITRVAKAGATTTYIDRNIDIPGTTKAYVLNMLPGQMAITWRQFLPMTRFNLFPTNAAVIPWAQLLFGYLRIGKRNQHAVIKNILPSGSKWRPFG